MLAAGANEGTYRFCTQYIFRTVAVGAVPTVLNQELAHLVRAEGHSAQASFGVALGGVLSNITINRMMDGYSNAAVAGIGVAKKTDMLSYAIATGMSQGVLPLTGYNYSSKNYRRMKSAIKVNCLLHETAAIPASLIHVISILRSLKGKLKCYNKVVTKVANKIY